LLALTLGATAGCDQLSKSIAARRLSGGATAEAFGGALRFELAGNRGAFLSLGSGLPEAVRFGLLVVLVGAGLATGLAVLLRDRRLPLAPAIGIAMVLGGGVGNLVDRLARGSVTDFAVLACGSFRTGVFNAADAAITLGAAIALIAWPRRGVH